MIRNSSISMTVGVLCVWEQWREEEPVRKAAPGGDQCVAGARDMAVALVLLIGPLLLLGIKENH
ncbi:hypothetical protein E2C01_084909 [Portunus trituberculatus]|uniref:Uncharacterized protein n=1 Tax=Portunus trituberculatus TaxID=210409 RepID=A0A5B7J594_PORTR|nr:hypothetical protein [Portunus trituberculatus]